MRKFEVSAITMSFLVLTACGELKLTSKKSDSAKEAEQGQVDTDGESGSATLALSDLPEGTQEIQILVDFKRSGLQKAFNFGYEADKPMQLEGLPLGPAKVTLKVIGAEGKVLLQGVGKTNILGNGITPLRIALGSADGTGTLDISVCKIEDPECKRSTIRTPKKKTKPFDLKSLLNARLEMQTWHPVKPRYATTNSAEKLVGPEPTVKTVPHKILAFQDGLKYTISLVGDKGKISFTQLRKTHVEYGTKEIREEPTGLNLKEEKSPIQETYLGTVHLDSKQVKDMALVLLDFHVDQPRGIVDTILETVSTIEKEEADLGPIGGILKSLPKALSSNCVRGSHMNAVLSIKGGPAYKSVFFGEGCGEEAKKAYAMAQLAKFLAKQYIKTCIQEVACDKKEVTTENSFQNLVNKTSIVLKVKDSRRNIDIISAEEAPSQAVDADSAPDVQADGDEEPAVQATASDVTQ